MTDRRGDPNPPRAQPRHDETPPVYQAVAELPAPGDAGIPAPVRAELPAREPVQRPVEMAAATPAQRPLELATGNAEFPAAGRAELPAWEPVQRPVEMAAATPAQRPLALATGAGVSTISPPPGPPPSANPTGPTTDDPFRFPVDEPLPPYSSISPSTSAAEFSRSSHQLIAIPQVRPTPTTGFLPSYPVSLLRHGIPQQTFLSFLETLSAFLTAKVSNRAVAHAADVAADIGEGPKSHFKEVVGHTRGVFRGIGKTAKKGDVFDAFGEVVAGAVTVPITAALGVAGAAISIPSRTLGAVAKKPLTQRQRAEAYLAVANKDWFRRRGLEATLVESGDVADLLGLGGPYLREMARGKNAETAEGVLGGLGGRIERLEVLEAWETIGEFEVGPATLWLLLRRAEK